MNRSEKRTAKRSAAAGSIPPGERAGSKEDRYREQSRALTRLARSEAWGSAEVLPLLREITEVVGHNMGVRRTSVWLYSEDKKAIRCVDLYEKTSQAHSSGVELSQRDYPTYFESLTAQRAIAAHDAHTDPRTAEFSQSYLAPLGITSMLDAPIRVAGRMLGVICLEHVGPRREWTLDEQSFAASAADFVALGMEVAERRRAAEELRRSEERYRALAQNFPNGAVILFDHDLRYIVADGKGLAEVGLSKEAIEGKTIREAFPEDICIAIEPHYRAALAGERRVFEIEYSGRLYEVQAVPVRDETGRVFAGMVMTQNITLRRQAEEELRKRERLLTDAQAMAHLGVFEWRVADNVVTWSDELHRIFGLEPGEFGGTFEAFLERVHPEDREKVGAAITRAYREGIPFEQEERIVRPDGSVRTLVSKGEVVRDDNGRTVGIVGICQDVTELKKAQRFLEQYSRTLELEVEEHTRELREKQAQLVQSAKLASLGGLAAGIAHEINTPLGVMRSNNDVVRRAASRIRELLSHNPSDVDRREPLIELLDRIEQAEEMSRLAGARITRIISSLRSFARLGQATEDRVDLHEGIESTLSLIQHLLKDRIKVRKHYSKIPLVRCHPNQMNEVFMNLLLNAVEAIEGPGDITIRTWARDGSAFVEISDTGAGIPAENLSRIFDPGFTTKGVRVGMGLGLSIAHRVIEEHTGSIEVESSVDRGTTFRISVPIERR